MAVDRKKKKGLKRRQKKQLALLTVVFLITSVVAVLLLTPGFNIKKINVKGNSVIKEEEIIRKSGITTGVNIFDVSLKKAKENIEKIGYVESVKVKRNFPSEIDITVVEEVGVAYIRAKEGYVIITTDGRCVDITDGVIKNEETGTNSVQLPDLPIITGLSDVKYKLGKTITSENSMQLESLFLCLHELARQEYIFNVKEIDMTSPSEIKFYYMTRNLCVLVGDSDEISHKIESFGSVLEEIGPIPGGFIDLSRVDTLGQVSYRETIDPPKTKEDVDKEEE